MKLETVERIFRGCGNTSPRSNCRKCLLDAKPGESVSYCSVIAMLLSMPEPVCPECKGRDGSVGSVEESDMTELESLRAAYDAAAIAITDAEIALKDARTTFRNAVDVFNAASDALWAEACARGGAAGDAEKERMAGE